MAAFRKSLQICSINLCGVALLSKPALASEAVQWGYGKEHGPDQWAVLDDAYNHALTVRLKDRR